MSAEGYGCGDRWEDGHEVSVTSNLHPEDAETGVRAVEGDTFNEAGKGFAIVGGAVGDHAIRSSSMKSDVARRAS